MKLIVGLGNPGPKHLKTRHNLGFTIVDSFLKDYVSSMNRIKLENKYQSEFAEIIWQPKSAKEEKVIVLKPLTYMNNSGLAVAKVASFYKIKPLDIWIIHDDIDIPLGGMKIRYGGSSAGHKGVESIMEILKTDKFWRFRMGIGAQREKVPGKKVKPIDDYVLSSFSEGERGKAREEIKKGVKAIEDALEEGLEKAMNRFNTK